MKRTIATVLLLVWCSSAFAARFPQNAPSTTNNDDSCDIGVYPAATLLLPYFEVDFTEPQSTARTTLFTITNTSNVPQIAKVTLWTDWAFPVLDFNIFLTGYDVQALNLYDIIGRGIIANASTTGTSIDTTPGYLSLANTQNPHFGPQVALHCAAGALPGRIPPGLLTDIRIALTTGTSSGCGTARVGAVHSMAVGYATIDVVSDCTQSIPPMAAYFDELLYDNVLIGDYQQIDPNPSTGNYAGGNPLVHIRAIPDGGAAGAMPAVNLPYTFYDRLTPASGPRTRDRRQPLSSAFAARFIQGGPGALNTNLKIWREAATGPAAKCADYRMNSQLPFAEMVRFDEHENATTFVNFSAEFPLFLDPIPPASSAPTSSTARFPPLAGTGDVGGWLYLNLHNDGVTAPISYTVPHKRATQNWVVVAMSAAGRFSVEMDASPLGNGCSPALPASDANNGTMPIGPMPATNP
ncbi:MAG TPA: hypothetical protein VN605_07095 [Thermoanaerobaculia bacterium]|nr:hypothetical protein [Thermoanaerobaculia bacterium]